MYVHEWYKGSDTGTSLTLAKSLNDKHLGGVEVRLQPYDAQKASSSQLV